MIWAQVLGKINTLFNHNSREFHMTDHHNTTQTQPGVDAKEGTAPRCHRRRGPLRWVFRALLVIALMFGIGAAVKAYRWHNMGDEQRAVFVQERVYDRVSKRLDLQPAQQAQLKQLLDQARQQGGALNLSSWRARAQAVVAGPQFDQVAAQRLIADATQTLQREAPQLIRDAAAFYDGLNPEQQAQVRARLSRQDRD